MFRHCIVEEIHNINAIVKFICINYISIYVMISCVIADAIPTNRAMYLQIIVAMKAMPWYSALPTLSEYMVETGWTRCFSSISEVGWPMYFNYLIIYLILVEFGIYWMHRELHDIKPLYKYLHATHHIYNKQNTLSPFAGKHVFPSLLLLLILLLRAFLNFGSMVAGFFNLTLASYQANR